MSEDLVKRLEQAARNVENVRNSGVAEHLAGREHQVMREASTKLAFYQPIIRASESALKPCRICGHAARIESFGPADHIEGTVDLWVCSQSTIFQGKCTGEGYFSEEEWNRRTPQNEKERHVMPTMEIEYDESDGSCTVYYPDGRYYSIHPSGLLFAGQTDKLPIRHEHQDLSKADFLTFQKRVDTWIRKCFTAEVVECPTERNRRFLEEAIELVQACGMSRDHAHWMVDYVFNRDIGDKPQEVGGVGVCLAALCNTHGINLVQALETELTRIDNPETILKIRNKQAAKPKYEEGVCYHPKTVTSHMGDGTPVEFCPDCGKNISVGKTPREDYVPPQVAPDVT